MKRRDLAGRLRGIHNDVAMHSGGIVRNLNESARGAAGLFEVIEEIEGEADLVEMVWEREETRSLATSISDPDILLRWAGMAFASADERFEAGKFEEAIEDAELGAAILRRAMRSKRREDGT